MYLQRFLAFLFLILFSPFLAILSILIKLEDGGGLIFTQKRAGRGKKPFNLYKIRTMVKGAEKLKGKYKHLNEADGPVFKIRNDPRFTKVGRFLARCGLDEIPQLINILKGEMSFVGPRPLPLDEAKKVSLVYKKRFGVLPGITSTWASKGSRHDNFKLWMSMDVRDVEQKSLFYDLDIALKTVLFLLRLTLTQLRFLGKLIYRKGKEPFYYFLVASVIIAGIIVRVNLSVERAIWADEVFYFNTAVTNSYQNLLSGNYIIRDNPPFFLIVIKLLSEVSKEIAWLRLPGILIFAFLSLSVFPKILRQLGKISLITFLTMFSFSPFFVNLNFWISPYNFVLLFMALELYLLQLFLKNKIKGGKFAVLFSLLNLLAINSHYSAVYLFLFYPVLAAYFFFTKDSRLRTFLSTLVVSGLSLVPNIIFLIKEKSSLYYFLTVNLPRVNLDSLFFVYFYILGNSLFGFEGPIVLVFSFLLLALGIYILKRVGSKYIFLDFFFLVFFVFFFLSGVFLFFLSKFFPSVFVERTFLPFHLGIYFLISAILAGLEILAKKNKEFMYFAIVLSLITIVLSFSNYERKNEYIPGNVRQRTEIKQENYDMFTQELKKIMNEKNYSHLVLYGNDSQNGYQKKIFLNYYLRYGVDWNIKKIVIVNANSEDEIALKDKFILVNFDKKVLSTSIPRNIAKGKEFEVVDFWSFQR